MVSTPPPDLRPPPTFPDPFAYVFTPSTKGKEKKQEKEDLLRVLKNSVCPPCDAPSRRVVTKEISSLPSPFPENPLVSNDVDNEKKR